MTQSSFLSAEPGLLAARRRGILLVLGAAGTFALVAALIKGVGTAVPLAQIVLFRNLFALPALLLLLRGAGGWQALRTRNPRSHALRTFWGLLGMIGAFYGYAHLPLATATALGFTMPLFLTVIGVAFFNEVIRWRRGLAVVVGFLGVLIVVRPGMDAGLDLVAAGMVLLGALGWAMAMITIRQLGAAGEQGVTIVLWFAFGAAGCAALVAIPGWVWPGPREWLLLAGVGLLSALAQVMMTEAYRSGEATLLAPFEYSGIIWTSILGALLWAELPDGWDFAGVAVLVGSGLYIWHREVQLGIRR